MSRYDKSQAPYFDDYDPTKGYTQLLAVPGKVAQARELTQVQSIMRDIIKGIGDSLMKDGDIIDGCQVSVNTAKTAATISSGKVYIDGVVYKFSEQTLQITGTGTETIGIMLDETIITETTDSTLRDPAIGYDNYNKAGAHRLKGLVTAVINEASAAPIAVLVDGELQLETYSPEYDTLTQTLARRTFDESGSYIVNGLDIKMEDATDPTKYVAVVEAGKAYVMGYELGVANPRRLTIPRSTTYDLVTASNYVYIPGTTRYMLDEDLYVKDIYTVTGTVLHTESNKSITTGTDRSLLDKLSVIDIIRVYVGTTIYEKNVDYELERDGTRYYVKWKNETFPSSGAAYTVEYSYTKTFTTTEYSLVVSGGSHYIQWTSPGTASAHPISGSNFTVQYNQYLARKDVIYIDQFGTIGVKLGIPAEYGYEAAPTAPLNTLALAIIMSPPNGSTASQYASQKISVTNVGLSRFTMQDIKYMLDRIRTLEYDSAVLSLENDARSEFTENEKKGILTDPFVDFSRVDMTYNIDTDGTTVINSAQPIFKMAIDFEANIAYLPVIDQCIDMTYTSGTTTAAIRDGRLAMLGVSGAVVALEQLHASRSFLINPYSIYPGTPSVTISPFVDNWIDETIIEVPVSLTTSTIIATSTNIVRSSRVLSGRFNNYTVTSTSSTTTEVGATTETFTRESVISEQAINYIRQREITVYGEDFPWNLDNIKCYFDEKLVALTPIGTTQAGTVTGSVKSNGTGAFEATFTIPEGVRTGIREVKLVSDIVIDGWENNASTTYQAYGIARTIERTVTTVTTVLLTRAVTVYETTYIDPVGQSFVLDKDTLLTGVDVYFESKPTTGAPVILEIRGVTNGVINNTIYAHKSLQSSQVSVSSNASVPTRFTLDSPAYIEKSTLYAFVLKSNSDEYRIWAAEMGDNDIATGDPILKNVYLSGVMYSSSNNAAWTIHQTSDLKFRLISSNYSTEGVVNFNHLTGLNWTTLTLLADSMTPAGTEIDWEYSLDGSNYHAIAPNNTIRMNRVINNVYLRATLSKTSATSMSPILALDTVSLVGSRFELTGDYILKNITNLDPYDEVQLVVETYVPAGTTLTFYCSHDDGATWDLLTKDDSKSISRNYGWTEHTYLKTYSQTYTQCRLRIHADSNTSYTSPAVRRFRGIMTKEI